MIKWASIPFFRFALAFIAGILFYIHSPYTLNHFYLAGTSLFLYGILYILAGNKKRFYTLKPFIGTAGLLVLFSFGIFLSYTRDERNQPSHIMHTEDKILYYEAVVVKNSEERANTFRTELVIQKIKTSKGWKNGIGKILLYSPKNNFHKLIYGDHLLIKGAPSITDSPANPYEFDYKTYLQYQQIFHTHFIKPKELQFLKNDPPSAFIASSLWIREKADHILRAHISGDREYKIASALVLGIRSTVENELKSAYSATGTMHVLAVSGLHVGIVVFMLSFVLRFLKSISMGRIIFPALVITLLWFYAFVTGFSASVIRAVIMFSFVILAQSLKRNTNVYNTLALSAFVLLCIDPFLVMDVGFQLSFLAVLGIIYFQPMIHSLIDTQYYLTEKIWQCTSVSIAAQIATLPVCLFYFHQFPLNFVISNLIAIPLSIALLYAGCLLLLFSFIPGLNSLLGWSMELGIWFMNQCMLFLEHLPYSVIQRIDIDLPEVMLLYLIILLTACFFHYKKLMYAKAIAVCAFALCMLLMHEKIYQKNQEGIIAFAVRGHTAVGFIKGNQIDILADSLLIIDKSKQEYHMLPFLIQHGIDEVQFFHIKEKQLPVPMFVTDSFSLLQFNGRSVSIEHKSLKHPLPTNFSIPYKIKKALVALE